MQHLKLYNQPYLLRELVFWRGGLKNFYDLNKLDNRTVIQLAHKMGIFDRNARTILVQCLDKRNAYAHFGQTAPEVLNTLAYLNDVIHHIELIHKSRYEHAAKPLLQAFLSMAQQDRAIKISQLGIEQIRGIFVQAMNDLELLGDWRDGSNNKDYFLIFEDIARLRNRVRETNNS